VDRPSFGRASVLARPRVLERLDEQPRAVQGLEPLRSRDVAGGASRPALVARVDEAVCTLCGACQAVCPTEAIGLGKKAVKVNAAACCGCGACVAVCPNEAMRLD
jgi:Na+-translocating ferredoxin:NAD+ oxidoreductase RNF subunit RnfB